MPQIPVENNERLSLRIASKDKSLLIRAAVLQGTHLTEFITRTVVSAAQKVVDQNERIELTERDSVLILNLLEEPPVPNTKLMAASFELVQAFGCAPWGHHSQGGHSSVTAFCVPGHAIIELLTQVQR